MKIQLRAEALLHEQEANLVINNLCPRLIIECNPESIVSILENLINNAIDACGQEAKLKMIFTETSECLLIIVQDNGPGISASLIERVFEPFFY